ncbi:MAG: hypothetical protein V2J10_05250 [Wenzhouxiangella sp.]|nr:hypothetical protein [Wenzhouxiangella sp.]
MGDNDGMYSIRHLIQLSSRSFSDMLPALEQAFNRSRDDDRLEEVFGPNPRWMILGLTFACLLLGQIVEGLTAELGLWRVLDASALLMAAAFALVFRRYLFGPRQPGPEDFPWLAATLIPGAALMTLSALIGKMAEGEVAVMANAPTWTLFGSFLVAVADSLALAAGLTIAVAALCYSKRWSRALKKLLAQFITFKIIVFIMVILFVEIGIVGAVLSFVFSLFGIRFPYWIGESVDQYSYALLMGTVYCAVIGATWMACRQRFRELIETGEADVLSAVRAMADPEGEEKNKRKKEKKEKATVQSDQDQA